MADEREGESFNFRILCVAKYAACLSLRTTMSTVDIFLAAAVVSFVGAVASFITGR